MADNDLIGKVALDVTEFKNGANELRKQVGNIETSFRASAAVMGDWSNTSNGLKSRMDTLTQELDKQKQRLDLLKKSYTEVSQAEGNHENQLKSLANQMYSAETAISKTSAQIDIYKKKLDELSAKNNVWKQMGDSIAQAGDKAKAMGDSIASFGQKLTAVATSAVAGGTALLAKGIYSMATSASDLVEAQNVVENTFKTSSKAVEAWTNTTANSAGISKTASTQWAGFMGAMLKSSGVSEASSATMSEKLVQLTGDMSSFYNISTSDMWQKIQAGMAGETKPLKDLGINMSVANLQAYALSQGIKTSYDKMSQAEQTTLRYNYLLKATADAQGDFARTSGASMANQSRMFEENINSMKVSLGKDFQPIMLSLYKDINPFIEQEIPKLEQGFKALSTAITAHSGQLKSILSVVDSVVTKFSKLNASQVATAAQFAGVAAAAGPALIVFGKLGAGVGELQSKFGKGVVDLSKVVTGTAGKDDKFSGIAGSIQDLQKKFTGLKTTMSGLGSQVGNLGGVQALGGAFSALGTKIQGMVSPATKALSALQSNISNAVGGKMTALFNKLPSGVKTAVGGVQTEAGKLKGILGTLGGDIAGGLQSIVGTSLKLFAPAVLVAALVVGLGAADQQMGGKLDVMIKNVAEKGPALITNFISGITSKIPALMTTGATVLTDLINAITANLPAVVAGAVKILTSLVNGLTANLSKLIPAALSLITALANALIQNLPLILQAGLKLLVGLVQGITSDPQRLVNTIVTLVTTIATVLIQNLPLIITAAIQIVIAITKGLAEAIPQLIAALPQIVEAIWNGLKSVDWLTLGRQVLTGILEGFKNIGTLVVNAARSAGNDILNAFKSFFGIHSPSTVTREQIGKNISLGIVNGINDVNFIQAITDTINSNSGDLDSAAKKVSDMVTSRVSDIKDATEKITDSLTAQVKKIGSQIDAVKASTASEVATLNAQLKKLSEDGADAIKDGTAAQVSALQKQLKQLSTEETAELKDASTKQKAAIREEYTAKKQAVQDEIAQVKKEGTADSEALTKKKRAIQDEISAVKQKGTAEEDALSKKKAALNDEISARKTAADREIEQINKVKQAAEDAIEAEQAKEKAFVDGVDSLEKEIEDALKNKYQQEEQAQEDSLNTQLSNLGDWKSKAEDTINSYYDDQETALENNLKAQEDALDAAATAQENAIQAQIDALDAASTAEDRASKQKEYTDKISDLQGQIAYSHDDYNTSQLQKQLAQEQADYQAELDSEATEDKKASLQSQLDAVKSNADAQKQALETAEAAQKQILDDAKTAQLNNITAVYNAQQTALNNQLANTKATYEQMTTDASLEAQAEQLIMSQNQQAIVSLLETYSTDYNSAGQTLGEALYEGFKPKVDAISQLVQGVAAQISAAQVAAQQAMAAAAAAAAAAASGRAAATAASAGSTTTNKTVNVTNNVTTAAQSTVAQAMAVVKAVTAQTVFSV